jgi:L-ascorbate metabolism protein UlaG (beta-lactamase superfamily)
MGRFEHLAAEPRGVKHLFRWKVVDALAGRNQADPGGFVTPRTTPDLRLVRGGDAQMTWIGHASFLLTLGGLRVLVDPVFSERLGPHARLTPPGIPLRDMPSVDVVLLTHNHRDHFDEESLRRLGKAPCYVAPLGNGALLRRFGAERVVELDWWQSIAIGSIEVTLVPAQHWSARYLVDRNEALWGGYVIRGPEATLYHSGDTAFFDGFTEIGRRLGPIDWAMLPIGAYAPRWFMAPHHMCPEETSEAARMLGARNVAAMHWGTFRLSDEPTGEPPERARAAFEARRIGDRLFVPAIGETRPLR